MESNINCNCTVFSGTKIIATGQLKEIISKVKDYLKRNNIEPLLIFDDMTSEQLEIDFSKTKDEILKKFEKIEIIDEEKSPSVGRPKLGVVSREISLLPRHWEWLSKQPKGASATLRILVEEAKKQNQPQEKVRQSQDATYKFMNSIAGNLPNYEEALRALYSRDKKSFQNQISSWPKDIVIHIKKLSKNIFD